MPYPNSGKTLAVNGKVNAKEGRNKMKEVYPRCAVWETNRY